MIRVLEGFEHLRSAVYIPMHFSITVQLRGRPDVVEPDSEVSGAAGGRT